MICLMSKLFAALLLMSALVLAGAGGPAEAVSTDASGAGLRGLTPQPLPHAPAFTLTDTAGRPFDFKVRARGKLVYLYFGYTHCPDVCPATMGDLAYALRQQPRSARRGIEVVFVTVDPRRDTRKVLRTWLDHFGGSFVGLTGTRAQIERAEEASGVPFVPGKVTTHSSLVLAYSPDGVAHVVYTQGFTPGDYAHDLPLLLRYS
jgi:protein SCO1/2